MNQATLAYNLNILVRMKYVPKDHIKFRMLHPISPFLGEIQQNMQALH